MKEIITVTGPAKETHKLSIRIIQENNELNISATYISGSLHIPAKTAVVDWTSSFEAPFGQDLGFVDIGAGSRHINVRELQGIGLGSFLMALIIRWAKTLPELPVATICLSADDAKTNDEKNRRNRFWRKLGFELILDQTESYGHSAPMLSSQLIEPELRLAEGWRIIELNR